jgi:quercetin dioxygenase-like cupin family protein
VDDARVVSPQDRLAVFFQDYAARPMIPASGGAETLHIGDDELPWLEAGDGSAIQLLHVDLNQGLWISKTRLPPGYTVATHYHTGLVFAVTLKGEWHYKESPQAVNRPGSYLFEPASSRHTLVTPPDAEGDMITWFAIYGANINLDDAGNVTSMVDARSVLNLYRGYCDALGLDYAKLIVQGE